MLNVSQDKGNESWARKEGNEDNLKYSKVIEAGREKE